MAAPLKSPEAKMEFLMTIIASFDGKVDWDKVAVASGLQKNGAGSYQAYRNILKMYNRKPNGGTAFSEDALKAGEQAVKKKHAAKKDSVHLEPHKRRKKTEPEEEE